MKHLPVQYDNWYRTYNQKTFDGLHNGIDFRPLHGVGSEVYACEDGIVLFSDEVNGYGGLSPAIKGGVIFILHGDVIAQYGHVSRLVFKDNVVKKGDIIGKIRDFTNKDNVNGFYHAPHLHFSIWNGKTMPNPPWGYIKTIDGWIDPLKWLQE